MKATLAILGGVTLLAVTLGGMMFETETAAVTVTGCLRQGSANTVYVLRSATAAGEEGPPRDYLLVAVAEGVNPGAMVNRQVAVDGDAFGPGQGPEPPAGANTVERALRRLSVAGARVVADSCSAG